MDWEKQEPASNMANAGKNASRHHASIMCLLCVINKQKAPGSNFRKILLQLAYLVRYLLYSNYKVDDEYITEVLLMESGWNLVS